MSCHLDKKRGREGLRLRSADSSFGAEEVEEKERKKERKRKKIEGRKAGAYFLDHLISKL